MEAINNPCERLCKIKVDKIKPFYNICKVTGQKEECNIEIEYQPTGQLLEMGSYREYFKQEFNEYIETLTESIFNHINNLIHPNRLKVTVFLTEETLTPWRVTFEK